MAPKWDDDFDFDDMDQSPKKKQNTKKKAANDDDFFDDNDGKEKLPTISQRGQSGKSIPDSNRNSKRFNPYADKLKNKNSYGYDADAFEE